MEGQGGLFEFIEQRLKENGHVVIVVAEGAGQDYVAKDMQATGEKDASGNKLLLDVGPWLSQKIKVYTFKALNLSGFSLAFVFLPAEKKKEENSIGLPEFRALEVTLLHVLLLDIYHLNQTCELVVSHMYVFNPN